MDWFHLRWLTTSIHLIVFEVFEFLHQKWFILSCHLRWIGVLCNNFIYAIFIIIIFIKFLISVLKKIHLSCNLHNSSIFALIHNSKNDTMGCKWRSKKQFDKVNVKVYILNSKIENLNIFIKRFIWYHSQKLGHFKCWNCSLAP